MYYKILWFLGTFFRRLKLKKIGILSYFAEPVFIYGGRRISIGNKVRIFPGARMETHNNGSIIIGNNISIGQNLHLISSNEKLEICGETTISGSVFITNIDHDYTEIDVHILDQRYIVKTTFIGQNCFIGYGAVIQAGTILGKQCIVGANSVVRGEFPDYCVIVGSPAKIVKRYNLESKTWEKTDIKGNFK
jgi:acetyltransferase-like isoleucine patch superfamily enzyme